MPLIKAHAEVSSEARGLNFCLSLHLHPYFMYASSEGSGGSAHMLPDAISTKVLCTGPYKVGFMYIEDLT